MSEFNNKSIKIFQINADGNIELIEGVDPMSALIELSKIFVMQQVRIKRLEEALDTFTCVVILTPMKWNRALQEAFDMARAVLKAKEDKQ